MIAYAFLYQIKRKNNIYYNFIFSLDQVYCNVLSVSIFINYNKTATCRCI